MSIFMSLLRFEVISYVFVEDKAHPLELHYPSHIEAPRGSVAREVSYSSMTAPPDMASSPVEMGSAAYTPHTSHMKTQKSAIFHRVSNKK